MQNNRACNTVRSARRQLAHRGYQGPPVVIDEPYLYENRWLSKLREAANDNDILPDISDTQETAAVVH